jgi:hypothetical protein
MVWRLRRHKPVAALNGSLAAVVGIGRRALALLAAIRRFLIELSSGEAVEGTYKQEDCQNGDGDVQATAHLLHNTMSFGLGARRAGGRSYRPYLQSTCFHGFEVDAEALFRNDRRIKPVRPTSISSRHSEKTRQPVWQCYARAPRLAEVRDLCFIAAFSRYTTPLEPKLLTNSEAKARPISSCSIVPNRPGMRRPNQAT